MERRDQIETADGIRLELAGYVTTPPGWSGPLHAHPFWELIFLSSGEGSFDLEDKQSLSVKAPAVVLMKPEDRQQFRSLGGSAASMLYIGFTGPASSASSSRRLDAPDPRLTAAAAELSAASEATREILLNRFRPTFLRIVFDLSLRSIEMASASDIPSSSDRHAMLVEKVKAYLSERLDRSVEIASVGEAFYLSPHYLADLFKSKTGMGPKQFHHSLRMRESERLLREEGLSVTETADRLGFGSVHYFSRRYSEFFGHSPTGRGRRR